MKNILTFIILTILFSSIFFVSEVFLGSKKEVEIDESLFSSYDESNISKKEKYLNLTEIIEKTKEGEIQKKEEKLFDKIEQENKKSEENIENLEEDKIKIKYIPVYFYKNFLSETRDINSILRDSIISFAISHIKIELYKDRNDVRWRMKDMSIKMFSPQTLERDEFIAVFIHELWHYFDLYFLLEDSFMNDTSNKFYEISWNSTKVMKQSAKPNDFVSWYSMTNKYEDFAESFTYYVLHNKDFAEKAKKSNILMKKYVFFKHYVFRKWEFEQIDFNEPNKEILDYYRDITKIDFSYEKLLQYIKKSV